MKKVKIRIPVTIEEHGSLIAGNVLAGSAPKCDDTYEYQVFALVHDDSSPPDERVPQLVSITVGQTQYLDEIEISQEPKPRRAGGNVRAIDGGRRTAEDVLKDAGTAGLKEVVVIGYGELDGYLNTTLPDPETVCLIEATKFDLIFGEAPHLRPAG